MLVMIANVFSTSSGLELMQSHGAKRILLP